MDEKQRHRLESKWAEMDKLVEDEALRALMAHSNGRKFLWRLLTIGKVGTQPFAANALHTSFNCGELNVGQQILAHILEVDPAGYVRMMQEQASERSQRERQLNTNGAPEPDRDAAGG